MMHWLPPAKDFRAALRAAQAMTAPAERLEALVRLSNHQLGFLETIQIDRLLGPGPAEVPPGFTSLRLAIVGASTLDHLAPPIRVAGLRRRLVFDVQVGGYGQYRQALLDPTSELHRFAPQILVLSMTAQTVIAGIPLDVTADDANSRVARAIDDLRVLWRKGRAMKATVIQQNFLDSAQPLFGSYDRLVPGAPARLVSLLNEKLAVAAAEEGVLLLDIAGAVQRDGIGAWYDVSRWLQAKQEIAPQAAPLYGDLVARIVAAQRGLSRKCLVLDLDNTLWGGVIGDDGLDGIVLGQGSGAGEAHLALQLYAKQLKERGIILAVCSKNEMATAEGAFRDHPEMALKREDIAAFVANWEDKAENLKSIAQRLNIGIDSLVFVDDNPAERTRVRDALPMVAVPELPDDPAHYVRCVAEAGYFEAVTFTADDRQRAEQYAANAEREALQGSAENMDDYLRGLEMSLVSGAFTDVDLPRIAQLINKTNQFNPTTRRYTADEVAAFAAAPENLTVQFRLLDRFGDNGLVSAMILRPVDGSADEFEIDSWIMSCRVFGRQLENEAMNIAVETARSRGIKRFCADYLPTPKNAVVAELYGKLGFALVADSGLPEGAGRWLLELDRYTPGETQIRRTEN